MNLRTGLLCLGVVLSSSAAHARDWFVREGATGGDGSMGKPFADPWQPLDKCEAGDVIHIAGGRYFGRTGLGTWQIPYDGVQLMGGYDADFKERDPWKHPTQLLWDKTSKNWPKDTRLMSNARNTVVDGLTLDMRDQIQYVDDQQTGRTEKPSEDAMRFTMPVTVRNCVIINPGESGVVSVPASTIENNLILNAVMWGVVVNQNSGDFGKTPSVIKNNTIAFSWDRRKPGAGGYAGAALALKGPATVTNNLLVHSDNNAIYQTVLPEKVSLTGNVFFMNLFSNLKFGIDGRDIAIDDKAMDSLDEVGLKAAEGNEVKNPQLELDPKWMDRFSKRTSAQEGKLEMNDWNQMRQLMGLTLIGTGGEPASGVAPPWDLDKALKLMAPKATLKAGARRLKLEVKFSGAQAAGPARDYARTELTSWASKPDSVDGKAFEMVVAFGGVANISGIPSQYKTDDYAGTVLYDKEGKGERVTGFFKKGSAVQREVDLGSMEYHGQGVPERLYAVRGVAWAVKNLPKAGFLIESIEALEGGGSDSKKVAGRDWFVRAGATGGNGSKDKPFKDPFQALEKVESGDTIHVAEGEYFGKLRTGNWKIDTTYITLLGGYDKDFKTRNPWKHPTRLYTPADFKGRRGGYTIEGDGDHTGTVIDGFIFDRKLDNVYTSTGDLDYSQSEKAVHLWLARPECVVRNNIFLNGAEGAVMLRNGITVENNIFFNHMFYAVKAERGFGAAPFIFKKNTVLFAWDVRFGQGHGSNGELLMLGTGVRAVVDGNLFEFADNDAIRLVADAKDVELTNNVFSHNLWSNVQRPGDWVAVDDRTWSQMADFGFKKLEGNQLATSGIPLDQAWFDVYLNRTAMVPGKVKMDDWNQLREILGQPVISTGGKAGTGLAPAYDWKKALEAFPRNPKVTAGARAAELPVKFTGVTRTEESHDYDEVAWDVAKSAAAWDKLDGKRVSLKVVFHETDNQFKLGDVKAAEFTAFTAYGPEGIESGLPLRMYVKKGTRAERVIQAAKSYSSGPIEQSYVIKGVVRANRQLVAEVVERAD